jgi:hypothetical protein
VNTKDRVRLIKELLAVIEERLGFEMSISSQIYVSRQLERALSDPQCDVFTLRKPQRFKSENSKDVVYV